MEWHYICGLFLILTIMVLVSIIILHHLCHQYHEVGLSLATPTACLGRIINIKLGMLYAFSNDDFMLEKIWSKKDIKKASKKTMRNFSTYDVITDDSLSSKLCHLGVDSDLALSLMSTLVKTSRSAEYLYDINSSARQARVVLRYQCTTKIKELVMSKPARIVALQDSSATHVIVGVEYGAEAFFVFDKDVPRNEDYDKTCKEIESLVTKLPQIAKGKEELSEEEILLSNQLQLTLYSDIPFLDASTFNHAVKICGKILPELAEMGMVVPKKAWLYPLHYINKNVPFVNSIKQHFVTELLGLFDQLHCLTIKCNSLMEEDVCSFFGGYHEQLIELLVLTAKKQRKTRKKVKKLVPKIRQEQSDDIKLTTVIAKINSFCSSATQWLHKKEYEIQQIAEYLALLHCPGIILLMNDQQFNSELGAVISLEFQVGQNYKYDPEEESWCDDDLFKSVMSSKIEKFKDFASSHKEFKFVVTISHHENSSRDGVVIQLYEPGKPNPIEFHFPLPPDKPSYTTTSSDKIKLKWSISGENMHQPIAYVVFFRSIEEQTWQQSIFDGSATEAEIAGLEPNTEYEFKVAARYTYGMGPESLVSDSIVTNNLPLAVQISRDDALFEPLPHKNTNSPISILKLKTRLVDLMSDFKNLTVKEFGKPEHSKPTKVVMLMGATGAGKSTLINEMVNYILGVKYDDPFRFMLICDENDENESSVPDIITAYTFYWQQDFAVPYNLTIIDTPGFGGTGGISRDKLITTQVKDFFSIQGANSIDQIHGIGIVTQSSLVCLTPTQKYVFDSILSIFGKDIEENIFIMTTFADSVEPPVIKAVEAASIPHTAFFPFNNSALYEDSKKPFTKSFWDVDYLSFESFFDYLHQASAVSLQLTCEVLRKRDQLESILNNAHTKIQDGLTKFDTLQNEKDILRSKEFDIQANKDFNYKVKITKQRKKFLPSDTHATNCRVCHFTCQYPSSILNEGLLYKCTAMDNVGKCKICPNKCDWKHHETSSYCFEIYQEEEIRTSEDLRKRFNVAKSDKDAAEQVINGLNNELADLSKVVYTDVREARSCIERLSEIALKPNPMTEVEYIDLLIEFEKREKRTGFNDRIAAYMKMRKQAQIMGKMTDKRIDEKLKQKDSTKLWQNWKW